MKLFFLIFLFLFESTVAGAPPPASFRQWLSSITIHIDKPIAIPPFELLGKNYSTTIDSITCGNISLGLVQSSTGVSPPKFSANVAGVGLGCSGEWAIKTSTKKKPTPVPYTSGSAEFVIANTSSLALGIQLGLDKDKLIANATATGCDFDVELGNVKLNPPPGNHDPVLEQVINFLLSWASFRKDISAAIDGIACSQLNQTIDTTFGGMLVNISNKVRPFTKPRPAPPPADFPAGAIDYREDKLLVVFDGLLNNVVGANGPANLNKIVNAFTNNTGVLSFMNASAPPLVSGNISGLANLSLAIKEANAGNFSTWTGFNVLEPTGPVTLTSHTATQSIVLGLGIELNISTLSKTFEAIPLSEQFKLELNLTKTVLDTMLDLALDRTKVSHLAINDIHAPGCILDTIDVFNLTKLSVNLSADDVELISEAGGSLEKDIDEALNNFFNLFVNGFHDVVPAVLNAFVSEPLRKAINVGVNDLLEHANCTLPVTPPVATDKAQEYTDIAFGCAGFFFVVVSLIVCSKAPNRRSGGWGGGGGGGGGAYVSVSGGNGEDTDSLGALLAKTGNGGDDDDDILFRSNSMNSRPAGMTVAMKRPSNTIYDTSDDDAMLYPDLASGSLNAEVVDDYGVAGGGGGSGGMDYWEGVGGESHKELPLILSPRIHWIVRYGVFLVLCFNIAMMVSANTAKGAEVKAVMKINDDQVEFPAFFTFSLTNTVKDFWEAKVYFLSLLVAILSGAWPYLKLVLMMMSWLFPAKLLPIQRRESMLIAIDALGKWSLVDTFIMVMFQIAFHFKLEMPVPVSVPGQPDVNDTLAVELRVQSDWGFTGFMIATMLSLFMSHVIVGAHRTAIADPSPQTQTTEKIAVAGHVYTAKSGHQVKVTVWGKTLFTLLLAFTVALVAYGMSIDSFSFNFFGLVGYALEYQPPSAVGPSTNYSIISLGEDIRPASPHPDSFITYYILVTYFIFGVGVPLLHLIFVLLLWFVKMTKEVQKGMLVATEVLNAWSGLDVLVLALIASIIEIKSFVKFMVGDKCDAINAILVKYMDKPLDGHDVCFDVDAELRPGIVFLFTAVLVHAIVANIAMSACRAVVRDREETDALGGVAKGPMYADKPRCSTRLGAALGLVRYD